MPSNHFAYQCFTLLASLLACKIPSPFSFPVQREDLPVLALIEPESSLYLFLYFIFLFIYLFIYLFALNPPCLLMRQLAPLLAWLLAKSFLFFLLDVRPTGKSSLTHCVFTSSIGEYFIGLMDKATEGVYKWVGGSSVVYTNWMNSHSNSASKDCVVMNTNSNGKWKAVYCHYSYRFICECKGACTKV